MAETERRSWTYEGLLREGLDPKLYEIAGGELVEVSGLSFGGGGILSKLDTRLRPFVEAHNRGFVTIGGRFLLSEEPRIERRPDLAWVVKDRLPPPPYPGLFEGHPDLAIEVLSPSDPIGAAAKKAREYLEYWTREVWNVDPEAETITVYRPGGPARAYSQGDTLESVVLAGFSVAVTGLFAGLEH